jgi:hypothetical protein
MQNETKTLTNDMWVFIWHEVVTEVVGLSAHAMPDWI